MVKAASTPSNWRYGMRWLVSRQQLIYGVFVVAVLFSSAAVRAEPRRIEVDFYPHGDSSQGHPIQMVFEADHIQGGRELAAVSETTGAATEELGTLATERQLAAYVDALRVGDLDDALTFWAGNEQSAARGRLEPVFEKQRSLMASVTKTRLHITLRYGGYLLFVVEHERGEAQGFVAVYPMLESEPGLGLTNALSQDSMFQILYFTFLDGLGVEEKFRTIN